MEILKINIRNTQIKYEENTNANHFPIPAYKPSAYVFLFTKNLITNRLIKKLDIKFVGLLEIKKTIGLLSLALLILDCCTLHNIQPVYIDQSPLISYAKTLLRAEPVALPS
jgi:hypothetical protein